MPCYTINQGLTAFFNEINMLMNANFSGHMRMTLKNILAVVMAGVVVMALGGCRGAKLSVANEQFERGEYFDAQKTYRKVYNKLTKKEQRLERGGVAYQMGLCYDKLGMSARAASAFGNALRYGHPDSTALLYMGQALQAEGKYAQAQKAFEDYLQKDPASAKAENGLAVAESSGPFLPGGR